MFSANPNDILQRQYIKKKTLLPPPVQNGIFQVFISWESQYGIG